ncbi:ATP-dependent DNA helicase DinG [Alginatibacterium sediminis]|nr:ATP-dependent DNA helicase DinG [Alginatibacterium sediminis]
MLSATHKKTIRAWYQNLSEQNPKVFRSRPAQLKLIAEIAKTIAGDIDPKQRILLAEAGTGTGKSLAYLLSAIPLARALNKTLVISTATVSLQQQLMDKELPLVHRAGDGDFSFALAKGRLRYCCAHKLARPQQTLGFDEPKQQQQLLEMQTAYQQGKWDGDRDSWTSKIADSLWLEIQADKHSCNSLLARHRTCPLQKARKGLKKANVVLINHSLLLTELKSGGAVVLPEIENCIIVLDEAHQFPEITRDNSASQLDLSKAILEVDEIPKLAQQLEQRLNTSKASNNGLKIVDACSELKVAFTQVKAFASTNSDKFESSSFGATSSTAPSHWRYALGQLPSTLSNISENYSTLAATLVSSLESQAGQIQDAISDNQIKSAVGEAMLSRLHLAQEQADTWANTLALYGKQDDYPVAYWMSENKDGFVLNASAIEVGGLLREILWDKAYSVIALSATLSALGRFDHFLHQSGLYNSLSSEQMLLLPSPFDYHRVRLDVPIDIAPPEDPKFSKQVAQYILKSHQAREATLVLCNSYRLLNLVDGHLQAHKLTNLWKQGEQSNHQVLKKHRAAVKKGEASTILASIGFSEGIDLPGDDLTHLIVARLPFAVPSDPLQMTHSELLESRGQNPFVLITLPAASRRLIQSCGRLMRKEEDCGTITLLDPRLRSKHYGQQLINALPPFQRVF